MGKGASSGVCLPRITTTVAIVVYPCNSFFLPNADQRTDLNAERHMNKGFHGDTEGSRLATNGIPGPIFQSDGEFCPLNYIGMPK